MLGLPLTITACLFDLGVEVYDGSIRFVAAGAHVVVCDLADLPGAA